MAKNGVAPSDIRPDYKWRKAWKRNEDPQDFVFRSYPAVQHHITQQLRRKWQIEKAK
jgi:hypothetical protein